MQPAAKDSASAANHLTIPATWYHEAGVYKTECEKLFYSEWLLFCHEALLPSPGHYVAYTVAGRPILVLRGKDGQLKGFHNVCRHRASLVLKEGHGKTEVLRCMYHGWVYDTDGHLCKTPGFGGDEKSLCDRTSLFPVHVKNVNGLVFICMAAKPPSFEKSIGDLPAALKGSGIESFKFFDMATHPMQCNWKTYIENYMEGYHIPILHPELNRDVDMATYKVVPQERIARHETGLKPGREKEAANTGLWIWLWPNVAINIYKNGMNLEIVNPTGPQTAELRYCYMFSDVSPEAEAENRKSIDLSLIVTRQDIDICEIVQRNLAAGVYEAGELSPRHENGVVYFHDLVRAVQAKPPA
ncbi:MAG: aromatic ring-hydroxylating dioxygenase subunit alpha [Alphaproteobacteria bacterium]